MPVYALPAVPRKAVVLGIEPGALGSSELGRTLLVQQLLSAGIEGMTGSGGQFSMR
jgi:hypothetical protein